MKKFALLLALTAFVATEAKADVIKLTSLDWPPYSGESLKNNGASVAVAKEAFKAMGHELKVEFYPWQRAVNLGLKNKAYNGYFPEYYSDGLDCNFSETMGKSPLGFAEQKAKPVTWSSMDDLGQYAIGTVRGYVNTAQFDQKVASGDIKVDAATDDITNLRKIAAGRLALAVIDKNVMNYLLDTDASLKSKKDKIAFNAKLLEDKGLHICFRKDSKYKAIFDQGLQKINVQAIMDAHIQ